MPFGPAAEHTEIARLDAGSGIDAGGGQSKLEQLADGRGAGRHAMLEAEIVNGGQLFRREHDLKALGAKVVHGRSRNLSWLSSSLNEPTWREFHKARQTHQMSRNNQLNQQAIIETTPLLALFP